MRATWILLAFSVVGVSWATSLFLAPMMLPADTIRGIDGHANIMDHAETWAALPPFVRSVYAIGDLVCHQMGTRSWSVHGNQMPVDARMAAAFVASAFTLPLVSLMRETPRMREMAAQLVPNRFRFLVQRETRRLLLAWGIPCVSMLPAALDATAQLLGLYESTNFVRAVTGVLLGCGASFLFGACLKTLFAPLTTRTIRADGPGSPAP